MRSRAPARGSTWALLGRIGGADEMGGDLTLVMNKVRQESITNELLDIVGGAAAVGA